MRNFLRVLITVMLLQTVIPSFAFADDRYTWTTPEDVYAIGDLHGDLVALKTILFHMGFIDESGKWSGQKKQLVQMGDFVDKGPQSTETMLYLRELQLQAEAAGGKVTVLIGNHEMMELSGDTRVSHPNDLYAFPLEAESSDEMDGFFFGIQRRFVQYLFWGETSWDEEKRLRLANYVHQLRTSRPLSDWLYSLPAMVRINGNLFVHAGIESWAREYSIEEINDLVRAWVAFFQGRTDTAPPAATMWVIGPDGPLWTRVVGQHFEGPLGGLNRQQIVEAHLANLAAYDASRVVIGHEEVTPDKSLSHPLFADSVIRTDTGISVYYGPYRELSYYVFQGDEVKQVLVPLSETQRFVEPGRVYDNRPSVNREPIDDCIRAAVD